MITSKMTPRQRMLATFTNQHTDCHPVAVPYLMDSDADHWEQLTGLPVWKFYEWQYLDPAEHVRMYSVFRKALPFDLFQPYYGVSTEEREAVEIVHKEDTAYFHDKRFDSLTKVPSVIHEAGSGGSANETRNVFTKADARQQIRITPADTIMKQGYMDYATAATKVYGLEHFMISGGVVNTFYSCSAYVGLTNLFSLLYDDANLVHYMSERLLERNIEGVRAMAKTGGDAIYINDATATNDMISLQFFEEFSLPYLRETVSEIKRLGQKAIVVYFGGIEDRVEQILSTQPDALMMEASMKGFVNDVARIAAINQNRVLLFGNLNPYDDVEQADEEVLLTKMEYQYEAGTRHGRFVTSTGSPLTPGTSVARLRRFIDLAHGMACMNLSHEQGADSSNQSADEDGDECS